MIKTIADPFFLIIDLFCGAGGTTSGFVQAEIEGRWLAKVIACVNHDHKAIKSHWANHPKSVDRSNGNEIKGSPKK